MILTSIHRLLYTADVPCKKTGSWHGLVYIGSYMSVLSYHNACHPCIIIIKDKLKCIGGVLLLCMCTPSII